MTVKMKKLITLILAAIMLVGAVVTAAADGSPFTDVKEKRWSYSSIVYAFEKGYMDGVGGGKFDPAGTMTRGMVVTVLWRMEGKPGVEFKNDFTDVKSGKYYSSAVIWAKDNDIVNGVSEGKFDPNGKITREQLATMLYRYADFKGYDVTASGDLSKFPDAGKAHSYAKTALAWATGKGLIGGVKSGDKDLLDPRGNATREQFAAILKRFDDAFAEEPEDYSDELFSQLTDHFKYFGTFGFWSTELDIYPDGSFEGEFSDLNMGATGPSYQGETIISNFSGRFGGVKKVNDTTYSMRILELSYEVEPGKERIEDNHRYAYTEAVGLARSKEILVFLPGTPRKNLPDKYIDCVSFLMPPDFESLSFYGLFSENDNAGFAGFER